MKELMDLFQVKEYKGIAFMKLDQFHKILPNNLFMRVGYMDYKQ
jgi:hypothetical protein